jgi:hypothetical protein
MSRKIFGKFFNSLNLLICICWYSDMDTRLEDYRKKSQEWLGMPFWSNSAIRINKAHLLTVRQSFLSVKSPAASGYLAEKYSSFEVFVVYKGTEYRPCSIHEISKENVS